MTLMRWDPWREVEMMRRSLDRLLQEGPGWEAQGAGHLALDIADTNDALVVSASLPGFAPENVDISISGRTLTFQAESTGEQEKRGDHYLIRERHFGAMSRSITLPADVDSDKARAEFKNGVLTLTLPKAVPHDRRKITVETV